MSGMKVLDWFSRLFTWLPLKHGEAMLRSTLPALADELDSLAGSTEGEFLSIGEKLQDFYNRAEELSRTCSEVAGHMAGKKLGTVIEGFRDVIEGVNRLESGARRNTDYLRTVLDKLGRLVKLAEGFDKAVMLLRVLCVSIRIESSRLGDRDPGFQTLAEEVEKLSGEIRQRCSKLTESSKSLSQVIRQTLSRALDLETARQQQAGIVLERTMSGLESLLRKQTLSSKAAEQISTHYEDVSKRIADIVMSMQFHDITRQQIEHARDALAGLISRNPGQNPHLRLVGDVAALQAAQLKNGGNELASAVDSILDNLLALADLVEKMGLETSGLAGTADKTGKSFLAEIEAGFSSVSSALGTYGEADLELSSAMGSVAGMFGEISAQAGSIESIGEKIKLISLNAIVKACHIGSEGASLAVLAESIHHLSVETRRLTQKAGEALSSTISASDSLRAAVDDTDGKGRPANISEALRTQIETLENLNQDIYSSLTRMNLDGCALSEDIRKSVGEVSVHRRIRGGIGDIVARLEGIVAFSRSNAPTESPEYTQERMRALKAGYTMESERNVHDTILNVNTEENQCQDPFDFAVIPEVYDTGQASGQREASEDELGDNVELF